VHEPTTRGDQIAHDIANARVANAMTGARLTMRLIDEAYSTRPGKTHLRVTIAALVNAGA
jgi:hypothetical protein